MCTNFDNYFEINTHRVNTRNNKYLLKLPKVKLEFAERLFYCGKIYNDFPIEIRRESDYNTFLKLLKDYFKLD